MPQQVTEKLDVLNASNTVIITLNALNGTATVGGSGANGKILIRDTAGNTIVELNASDAMLVLGGTNKDGDITVKDSQNRNVLTFNGDNASLVVGAANNEGDIQILDSKGQPSFHLDGNAAALYIGTTGNEGDIQIQDASGRVVFNFNGENAALYIGADGNEGDVIVRNSNGVDTIHLNGEAGDIILNNADFAEDFDIMETVSATIEPGTVMSLDANGKLTASSAAYDKKVAGVISGYGKYRPGIIMDKQPGTANRLPVALSGKVVCKMDASFGPIEVGDLITTSPTPGHGMKATDPMLAFGSVIGKALSPLAEGTGMIPILVSLQ